MALDWRCAPWSEYLDVGVVPVNVLVVGLAEFQVGYGNPVDARLFVADDGSPVVVCKAVGEDVFGYLTLAGDEVCHGAGQCRLWGWWCRCGIGVG